MIINFTGQPETGKTTLANYLVPLLKRKYPEYQVLILDGDVIRKVTKNFDYTEAGRRRNICEAYAMAACILMAGKIDPSFKVIVIIALISPYLDLRQKLKSEWPTVEVHLVSQRNSREKYNVAGYEKPEVPYLHLDTTLLNIDSCATRIMLNVDSMLLKTQ